MSDSIAMTSLAGTSFDAQPGKNVQRNQKVVRSRVKLRRQFTETRIKLRIRNDIFETLIPTLERFPNTLLGCEEKRRIFYDVATDTFVFSRRIVAFDAILYYYQSYGVLIRPPFVTLREFERDCRYFEIDEATILRMKKREGFQDFDAKEKETVSETIANSLRYNIWCFLEYPETSKAAKVFAIFTFTLIGFSVLFACITTLPSIRLRDTHNIFCDEFFLTEFTLNLYFAVEYLFRLLTAPKRLRFLLSPLSIIDFIAVFPYFVILSTDVQKVSTVGFLKIMRTMRVLRLFRLTKQSKTFQTVMLIMSECIHDIFVLFICFFIACIVSASLQYYVELSSSDDTDFTSIPISMWWAIQTLVCLGYGDIIPVSIPGKLIAASVAIFGALTLSVPLLSVGGKYLALYEQKFKQSEDEAEELREAKEDNKMNVLEKLLGSNTSNWSKSLNIRKCYIIKAKKLNKSNNRVTHY